MKAAVLSDIHSNLPALEAVMNDIEAVDMFLFCGDIIGYYCWPNQVIEIAQEHGFQCVRGNHDEAIIQGTTFGFGGPAAAALSWNRDRITEDALEFLQDIPYTRREVIQGQDVFITHGSPQSPVEEYVYPEQVVDGFFKEQGLQNPPDFLLLGHTHVPFVERLKDTVVMNPGSVGQPRDGDPKASYGIIDLETRETEIRRVSYDIDRVAEKVRAEGLPEQLVERLYRGR